MKFSLEKIIPTAFLTLSLIGIGFMFYKGITDTSKDEKYERERKEAGELITQETKKLEGRVVFVDEYRIPKEIGGGFAGRRVIFTEKEYLRVRSNDEEYDLVIEGITSLHKGDSLQVSCLSQETLGKLKSIWQDYPFYLDVSNEVFDLALAPQIDGLVSDYRRIK